MWVSMQIARRMVAVLALLALVLGGLMLPAASAGYSDVAEPASSVTLVSAEAHSDAATLPSDCDHCLMEGEVLSGSACGTAVCAAVPMEANAPAPSGLSVGTAFVLRDQRLGGAADSPEPHPPRLSVLA